MIIKALMDMLKAVLLFFIGLFPALPDLSGIAANLQPMFDVLATIDSFVSVKLVASCVGALFVFCNVELFWSVIVWVYKKIPGVS